MYSSAVLFPYLVVFLIMVHQFSICKTEKNIFLSGKPNGVEKFLFILSWFRPLKGVLPAKGTPKYFEYTEWLFQLFLLIFRTKMLNGSQPTRTTFSRNVRCKRTPHWLSKFFILVLKMGRNCIWEQDLFSCQKGELNILKGAQNI